MRKNLFTPTLLLCILLFSTLKTHAHVSYQFSYVNGISSQCSGIATTPFSFQTTVKVDNINISNWTPSGFDYQIFYRYENIFSGTPQTGSFTNFKITYNINSFNTTTPITTFSSMPMQTSNGTASTNVGTYTGAIPGITSNGSITTSDEIESIINDVTLNASANCISGIEISTNTALSISLISFKADLKNNAVTLNWLTANEKTAMQYSLEKSADFEHWETIANVKPQFQSENKYHFIDREPNNGNNAYRLKMQETSNTFSYSNVAFIAYNTTDNLEIFPNPVTEATLHITGLTENAHIHITDITGRVVKNMEVPNQTFTTIDVASLTNGMYFINVTNPLTSGKETYKIMIAR